MARPPKWIATFGLPPLREYWREINRLEKEAKAQERAKRKARDKGRRKCRCEAYPWPHRPGGGLCCWPDPPQRRWQPKPDANYRPYWKRYAGIIRQIARANGMHPIKDRAMIDALMPRVLDMAKQVKRQRPRMRYRNVEITDNGLKVYLPVSGPEWERGE
jgi:hypothetical protein